MLLSVDPGYTSGSCIADNVISADNFRVVGAIAIAWQDRFDFFSAFFKANARHITAIIVERYKLFDNEELIKSQIGSEIPSARVIGIVETVAYNYGLLDKIVFQDPWQYRQVSMLNQHHKIVGPIKHNQVAYKHMRYYLKMLRSEPL